ncbi:MAG TPA: ergothioneine biosynthesis protein EgtC [Gammaproteobacteria bacterium]|nr:ergothioneine biosynthesis protein EgtC [Gammaproteobacteria bacterium]
MCRIAAYLGERIPLGRFLLDPPHSLQVQGWAPQELKYARLNADGFGFAWYADDGRPAAYVNPAPIWADPNLPHLARTLSSDLWLASVRSATEGHPVNHANTQPFVDEGILFDHNGLIDDFHRQVRPLIIAALDPGLLPSIRGNTESEYLFAALRQLLAERPELAMEDALAALMEQVEHWIDGNRALLTIVVSDGRRLYAVRHAIGDDCPTLYYTSDDETFPDAQLLASERLTTSAFWQAVPEHHILILDRESPPELRPL